MKSNKQFEFLVDKKKNTITINREFAAKRQLVWDCYTKKEFLDQWFAPEPLTTKTKTIDFKEGGHWHYAMVEPNGTEYWGRTKYITISPMDYYTTRDAFSNEQGEINEALPLARWKVSFSDKASSSMVKTMITYDSLEDLEAVIKMGMKDGMQSTLERLDKLLIGLSKRLI